MTSASFRLYECSEVSGRDKLGTPGARWQAHGLGSRRRDPASALLIVGPKPNDQVLTGVGQKQIAKPALPLGGFAMLAAGQSPELLNPEELTALCICISISRPVSFLEPVMNFYE